MIFCIFYLDWRSKLITSTNDGSHFELEIKSHALRPGWSLSVGRYLTLWSSNRSSINHNGRSSSVIANWQMEPIWLECIVFTSEHDADVHGVVLGRIEISVVSNEDWHGHFDGVNVVNCLGDQVIGWLWTIDEILDSLSCFNSEVFTEGSKSVECFVFEDVSFQG